MKEQAGSWLSSQARRGRVEAWLPCVALAVSALVLAPGVAQGQIAPDPLVTADEDPELRAGAAGCGVAPWEATALDLSWDDPRCIAAVEARQAAEMAAEATQKSTGSAVVWWPSAVSLRAGVQWSTIDRPTTTEDLVAAGPTDPAQRSARTLGRVARFELAWRLEVRAVWWLGARRVSPELPPRPHGVARAADFVGARRHLAFDVEAAHEAERRARASADAFALQHGVRP